MFDQYPYIPKKHVPPLQAVIRNHSVATTVNATLIAKMYKLALDSLSGHVQEVGFHTSSLLNGDVKLGSVTEAKTGLWLQLARVSDKPDLFLTFGQKWAMEQPVPVHGSISTMIW